MTIQDELIAFLDEHIRGDNVQINKERNIKMLMYFYGFGTYSWPTLEEIANRFDGVKTRERVRQIVNQYFRNIVNASDIPSLSSFKDIVQSRDYWMQSELEHELVKSELVDFNFSIRGLFNLLNHVNDDVNYEIYTPDLKVATRSTLDEFDEYFIINKSDISKVKRLFKKARTLPGKYGIVPLTHLQYETDLETYIALLKGLIQYSKTSWVRQWEGDFWYLFEDLDNVLINYSEKVFSVMDICLTSKLSNAYRNALGSRTQKYGYPPESLIYDYLMNSIYFENTDSTLSFIGQTSTLNQIENDVIEYLRSRDTVDFKSIREHLASKGYSRPHIIKSVLRSPLIYVDRSNGRGHYTYSLVGTQGNPSEELEKSQDRYKYYVHRLRYLDTTDETVLQKMRREQRILRDWLFEGKTSEDCAICGNTYSVGALVAAHKKKRSKCNTAERLDPYIVMPVCAFGCDFLYENKYIVVEDGTVSVGLKLESMETENEYIGKLVGREVNSQWLLGQKSYFHAIDPK